jgi:flagellar hook-associated protein 3 FlgL
MRIATEQIFQRSLLNLQRRQASLAEVRDDLSSGKRLQSAADDPAAAARVLDLRDTLELTRQFQQNGAVAAARLESSDSILGSVTESLQRVRELALRGRNGDLDDNDRRFIAAEVRERLNELVELANTRDTNGEYLFAGARTRTEPFVRAASGQFTYDGDQTVRVLQIGADSRLADRDAGDAVFMAIRNGNGTFTTNPAATNTGTGVVLPGSMVNTSAYQPDDFRIVFTSATTFDVVNDTTATTVLSAQTYTPGGTIGFNGLQTSIMGQPAAGDEFSLTPSANQSVFETVDALADALSMPQVSVTAGAEFAHAIHRALTDIDQALDKMLEIRTSVGARLRRIDSQTLINRDVEVHLTKVRSSLEDADIVDASVRLNVEITALQAAQQAFARTQALSLFDYL